MWTAFTALFPGRLWAYLALAVGLYAAGGATAWKVQNWRIAEKEKERVEQILADEQRAAKETFRKSEKVIAATNAAVARENRTRVQLASATALVDGLRSDLAAANRAAASSLEACTALSVTQSELLGFCAGRLVYYAEQADLWASDAIKLNDAWPTK